MFDFKTLKVEIYEHYFKYFNNKHNKNLVKQFIIKWINLVEIYSKMSHFIRFNNDIPVLTHLEPNSKSLIIMNFHNDEIFTNTSIFPICIFTAFFKNRTLPCKDSIDLLLLYIKITKIKYVAFYKMQNYKKILYQIKEHYPLIKFYPPSAFYYFCKFNRIYHFKK